MVDVGHMALVIAFVVAGYVAVASFLGAWRRIPELAASGRYGLYTVPALLLVSTMAVVYAFLNHDFSVRYVAENSNLAMPRAYTWVALYAGNAGSLLFLAFVFSVLAVLAVLTIRRRLPYTAPYATGLMALFLTFFLGIIVFLANPLERLPVTPLDGQGINPLLVHFGMFIHPPIQMTGLVSVAIPFSIAVGALLAGRGGRDDWVDMGRLWGMISWVILTVGLLLGAWWAYTILGWGGYWAWDPVENSALMPWLAMTAFVHSIMVQKRRGMFRMWNMVLIIVGFGMAQMGMFINRGGPVPSVHSFAQSNMGWLFLIFMAVTLAGSIAALIWRMDTLKSRERLDSMLSREAVFLMQNVLFLAVAFVTLWGTVFPIFSEAVEGTTVTVGAPFFNRVNGPLLLGLILLMGIGPLLPWRRATVKNLVRTLKYPVGVAVATAVVLAIVGIRQPPALVAFSICGMVATGIVHEWVRGTRSRHRNGESYPIAFGRLLAGNRPRYGGYIVHLSILMLAVGAIGSSFYSVQRDFAMRPGDTASLGDYTFRYLDLTHTDYPDREEDVARFEVYDGDSYLGIMKPFRAFYPDFRIAATRGAIRSTPIEDFYIVPSDLGGDGQAVFRVLINPLVWWMWASGPLLVLGVLLAISPHRRPARAALRVPAHTQTARA
uniref:Putative cytochrome C assembly protein n=1 Tax=uncultured marine microorganism HF4000_APKG8C21 TaxID=455553 RepID=B3TA19_9ZZZZ|nr:putative cytochrome C assembly protein [uncultured marine microorganism HF4000_APKG8C21]